MARRLADDLPTLKEQPKPAVSPPSASPPSAPAGRPSPVPSEPPADSRKPSTRRVLGRYRLLFPIARGGMGSVHAAVLRGEEGVATTFAIKLLHAEDRSVEVIDAFVQEAKLTANIAHPNVLPTIELGREGGEPFIVMPLARGVTLAALMRRLAERGEHLPVPLALHIAMQVATGLHAAHELLSPEGESLHVVHRDVSPQNVMLTYAGDVVLLDFGVAKLFDATRATAAGVIKGKFGYMSPEQLRAEIVDKRTDVFALGIVLFEVLTVRPLYSDDAPAVAALRIATEPPPSLAAALPDAPPELDRILSKAMAKDKNDRFDSALELRDALRQLAKSIGAADQADLAALLATHFAKERDAFEQRLRAALVAPADEVAAIDVAPQSDMGTGLHSATDTSSEKPVVKSSTAFAIFGVATLLGAGIATTYALTRTRAEPSSARAAPTVTATEAGVGPTSSIVVAPSTATATDDVSAAAPAASSSSSGPIASASARGVKRVPAATPSTASTPPPPPPATPPTATASVKGEPFRKW